MLTIWGRADSSNVQALMWCVAELGLAHRRIDLGHRFGGTDTPEFLAINPNGTVPVLVDGDGPPLWETGAILRYLANRYGPESFWPSDPVRRAHVDRWAEWSKINVAMGFTGPVFWPVYRFPETCSEADLSKALTTLGDKLCIADARFQKHPFLTGEAFTLADVQFGHVLYRYFNIDIPRPELPGLARYYARLCTRPAYRTHVMTPYAALRETP